MLLSVFLKRGWTTIKIWRQVSWERKQLRRLSEHLAKDIGISRAEAEREAERPFWDHDRPVDGVLKQDGKRDSCIDSASPERCLPAH